MAKARKKAGHRSWASQNAPVPGTHTGDIMSPETRSAVMSRIKGKDTSPERIMVRALRLLGFRFSRHPKDLPGRPDIVFRRLRLAVFVDGDFWHGWRFPLWEHKLSPKWRDKIAANRARDRRNFRRLRRDGWQVIRLWEHQIEQSAEKCLNRVVQLIERLRSPLGQAAPETRDGDQVNGLPR
jgi:DNA mismatch endonuclease (patch repair protein)